MPQNRTPPQKSLDLNHDEMFLCSYFTKQLRQSQEVFSFQFSVFSLLFVAFEGIPVWVNGLSIPSTLIMASSGMSTVNVSGGRS